MSAEKDPKKAKSGKDAGKGAKDAKGAKDSKAAKEPKQAKEGKAGKESRQSDKGNAPEIFDDKPAKAAGPARLQLFYRETVVKSLSQQFGYKSVMQVPRVDKIVLNMGVGEAVADKKILDNAVGDMTKIAGQKPIVTKARTSVANFKIREGYPIGCKVTLRGARMYEFLDRLVNVAMPRIRDFRGISAKSFDGRGNYNMGVKEQIIFPEVEYDKIDAIRGMNITISTTARTDAEARALLAAFKFPFRN
jgi:large subunit ribosomal protein L5